MEYLLLTGVMFGVVLVGVALDAIQRQLERIADSLEKDNVTTRRVAR